MSTQTILERLEGVRKSGDGWVAKCPAHEDRNPSLSITERNDKTLLRCHANCTVESICGALQLSTSDLFNRNSNGAGKIVATYDYVDEEGKLLYQNVRYEPKDFRLRRPDGKGWAWNLGNVRRVPYNLPRILASDFVLVVEGEKDVDTATKLGIAATSSKQWMLEFSEFLRDKEVAIIADADEAGRKTAAEVSQKLTGRVRSLRLLEFPGSKDLSDWIAAGGNKDALLGFIELQPEWKKESNWREIFDSFEEFENAQPLSFVIENFLPKEGATGFAGLSGHGKTWLLLEVAKAALAGPPTKLWDAFPVLERAERVVYLIPECGRSSFKHRLKLMGLYDYVESGRLLVRTLSKGPAPDLQDPRILHAVKGALVLMDTAIRWVEGEENSASDNQHGLATDVFRLLEAGALAVVPAYHSAKSFKRDNTMTLENALRGSGDLGAMLAACWAVKQLDAEQNIVHIENVKARDFQSCQPFQLRGRPFIDELGDFVMHKKPGECGPLMDEQQPEREKGGAPAEAREARAANLALLRVWLKENSRLTSTELVSKFRAEGIEVKDSTIRHYKRHLEK
ncbi:MAG TPA: AAA family ATPase [Candidatus Acidoferrales bacterium]|nr:AAA family ATPase [Candidatus Acidoferrales bacterium]